MRFQLYGLRGKLIHGGLCLHAEKQRLLCKICKYVKRRIIYRNENIFQESKLI